MQKNIYKWVAAFFFSFCCSDLSAQEKYEKESRIPQEEVPSKAVRFIDSLNEKNKLRWYFEEGLNRSSIEAKFIRHKKNYSVEFDTLGNVEDVEIEIGLNELDTQLKEAINSQLKVNCLKSKIEKVQIQFSGSEQELISKLKHEQSSPNLVINYEIVVRCTSKKAIELLEYLFNNKGELLSTSKIIFKNSSHLEY